MTPAPLVLVTGATGAVGPAVVHAALSTGCRVRTLSRHAPSPGLFEKAVDDQVGDIRDRAAAERALAGVDVVLHLAALLHLVSAGARLDAKYDDTNTAATAALVRSAAEAGASRFVFFSTIAVYGENRQGLLTEKAQPAPDSEYGRSKLWAESAVLEQKRRDGSPIGVVLRPAAVYGPRLRGNYLTLIRFLAHRRFMPVLPGLNRRTLVFDEDLAAAALTAAWHPAAPGRIFNVTDGTTHTLRDVTAAMCRALGRKPPSVGVPAAPLRATLKFAGPLAAAGPLSAARAMIEKYSQETAVDGALIQRELGVTPVVNLDEGWQRTVAGLRLAGAL
jgi:nucleoside-diphosphate-sugar epimerase